MHSLFSPTVLRNFSDECSHTETPHNIPFLAERGPLLEAHGFGLLRPSTSLMTRYLKSPHLPQTLVFEYEVAAGDLTEDLAYSDRHALVFGFNATYGSSGYESKLRSLVAQASTNPTVAVDRVSWRRDELERRTRNVSRHWP